VGVRGRRPQHLTEYPEEGTTEELADALDDWHNEPIVWMAERGHLREDELAAIQEAATEAKLRIGTGAEHVGSGGVDRVDQRAVKLWEAVKQAR
jgi:hypothetical protein